ncbi:MAG: peptidylprolyl isomerase, partial [Ignavibacteriales bacterium]|nr:peptidylprolyl isomerase [Ignavibacteriales bacterium]
VEEFTEDPAGKNNGGDLYYFTTGQMVTPFEDACYSLKKGEITKEPIHSVFGYHIIQVTDRKKAIGSVRVSHIMARFNSANPAPDDTMQAWKKISAMYDSAKQKRVNFATLAKRHSDDAGSAANGGDVGFFTRRRWVQAFDEAAFQLNVGQLSNIIRTPYGYHILKCTEVKPVASFDSLKEELKSQYLSSRFSDEKATFLESLKKKYGFSEDKTVFLALVNMLDTSKVLAESAWANSFTEEVRAKSLIQFMGKEWSVNSILPLVEQTPENQGTELIEEEFRVALNRVYEDLLLSEEAKTVEKKYPEFEKLMAEFVDGILLYRVEQEEVWAKVSVTDSALESFFNANRERFRFPHRVNTSVIHVGTDTLANEAYQKLQRGIPFDSVALMSNASILMRLRKGNMDWLNADQDTMTRLAWTMEKGTYSAPFLFEGKGWTLVYVNDKDSTRRKTFDEAGSEISNAYQDAEAKKFELQWLEGVKQRFAVTVHREVVEKAFAKKK